MTLAVPPSAPSADDAPGPLDDAVTAAVGRLSGEFADRVGAQFLVRVVCDCRRDLGGSPVGALPELVERLARYRLDRHIG